MGVIKKKIWLINQHAMPPKLESRLRTIKLAHYLTKMGYDITIFASSVMHNMNIDLIEDNSIFIERSYDDIKFVHIKTKRYSKNGISRLIGLFEFSFKTHLYRNKFEKPDLIIHSAGVPFGNILYFTAKKLKAKYIVEIQDLWPQSFVDLGIINKKNPLLALAFLAEKWLYKKADKVVFSIEGGKDYIKDKKWDIDNGGPIDLNKIYYINNGVDLDDFQHYISKYKLEDDDLESNNIKKIIYIGSIRLANNLKELINAAEILKDHTDIKFIIFGDGDDRDTLQNYCKERKLDNVAFKQKWIDPCFVPYVLSKSTVNILNYKSGTFGKYGGSQSKLFQYIASGKPICSNLNMMYCPINKYNLGIAKDFKSSKEYADAILALASLDSKSSTEMSIRAKIIAKQFDYSILAKNMCKLF